MRARRTFLCGSLVCFLAGILELGAQDCINISTGYDQDAGAILGGPLDSVEDDDYTISGMNLGEELEDEPAFTVIDDDFPIGPWFANRPTARWIGFPNNDSNADAGDFSYSITVTLPAADVDKVGLIGEWGTDDQGVDILINEQSTGITAGGFGGPTPFPASAGVGLFEAGDNTITFVVRNGGGPTGLFVDGCVGIPELATCEASDFEIHTGFDGDAGTILTEGLDTEYTVTGPEGSGIGPVAASLVAVDGFPIPPWTRTTDCSRWIGPPADNDSNGPPGVYTYAITINLPAGEFPDVEFAQLEGPGVAADDALDDVLINGRPTGFTASGFGGLTQFPPRLGQGLFQVGDNTLEFLVRNGGDAPNPTGFRIEAQVVQGVRPPIIAPEDCINISTGYDEDDELIIGLPEESLEDDDYVVIDEFGDEVPAWTVIDDDFPIPPWFANRETARWIGFPNNDSNAPAGTYTYTIVIDLPDDVEAEKAILIGGWGTDDPGQDIIINEVNTGITAGGFGEITPFPPNAGLGLFLEGENIIQFVVLNGGGPTGLFVDGCVGVPICNAPDLEINSGFVGDTNALLSDNDLDDSYIVTGPDGSGIGPVAATAVPSDGFPIPPWFGTTTCSRWIGLATDDDSNGPPGIYVYSLTVNLPADFDIDRAQIEGIGVAADDSIEDLLVNGNSTGFTAFGFDQLTRFPPRLGQGFFQAGENTIEFLVRNGGDAPNPTGFRIEGQIVVGPGVAPCETNVSVLNLSTGFDNATGMTIASRVADDHFFMEGPPGSGLAACATIVDDTAFPIPPWIPSTDRSRWIGTSAVSSNGPAGTYTYTITVNIPDSVDVATASIVGFWATDDGAADIRINGESAGAPGGGFTARSVFPPDFGLGLLENGDNVVEFLVNNGGGPTGLRVEADIACSEPDPNYFATGISAGLCPLDGGALDERFLVTGPAGSGIGPRPATVVTDDDFPIPPWLENTDDSLWVGLDGADSEGPPGVYTYTLTFMLDPGQNPARTVLTGRWATDDGGVDVLLNGSSLGITAGGFGDWSDFPAGAGRGSFVTGRNTLEFLVDNGGGPTGFRAEVRIAAVVEANPLDISTGFEQGDASVIGAPEEFLEDDDYTIISVFDGFEQSAFTVPEGFPIPPWIANSATSRWIGWETPTSDALPGQYLFEITVNLTEAQAESAVMVGAWAADDAGLDVIINDVSTGISTTAGFGAFTPFPADAGLGLFSAGDNVIQFLIDNAGGPAGLRVDAVIDAGPTGVSFLRGDANGDGSVNISDPTFLLNHLFVGGPGFDCQESADANQDGAVNISDAQFLLNFLFVAGAPIPPPNACGEEPFATPESCAMSTCQ